MSVGKKPCPECGGRMHRGQQRCGLCRDKHRGGSISQASTVNHDLGTRKHAADLSILKDKYKEALATIERQNTLLNVSTVLDAGLDTYTIEPHEGDGTSEGTVVAVASDWHFEERVGAEVGGLNTYNLEIAHQRADRFFQSLLRLVRLLQQDVHIDTVVLALLGDFVSGDIHEEFADLTQETPMQAIVTVQNVLVSGIQFLLDHSPVSLVIPCHSGNHARTTKTTRFGAENGHSIEFLMYHAIAAHFKSEPRVKILIPDGYHSYLDIYDQTIRFHHGHAIRYAGGVGGIFVPSYKAIAQWQKGRHADLDVFGHFHQMKDGGNFLCNGSLIGYNAFALSIKADFEAPRQLLFLVDKKRGRTCTWPILVN